MNIFVATPRSFTGCFFAQSILSLLNRCIQPLIAASILMFAGNAYAVITVGLSIENDLDSNGNITVINGGKVKVAYTVIQDDDGDLHKKDKIQLLRVSDDTVVASVDRGKKKTGTVSLKVKNSVGEQLYVRYIRKSGSQIATAPNQVSTIAKASLADLTTRLNAVETNGITAPLFSGDGSAGNLVVSSDINWRVNANAPANPNFADIIIDADRTLTVPAGTTLRCSGNFINNGTIKVEPNANSDRIGVGFPADMDTIKRIAGVGEALRAASAPVIDNNFGGNFYMQGGYGGAGLPRATAVTNYNSFRFGGGGATGHSSITTSFGGGGGLFKVQCNGSIQNNGSIVARGYMLDNGNAIGTGGGGGGGIVILAAMQSVENSATGKINADGAPGNDAISNHGAGGGGGGGIIILTAPNVTSSGTLSVAGGAAGDDTTDLLPAVLYRFGGGAGGASGGDGGKGGDVEANGLTTAAEAGSDGYVIQIPAIPLLN